MRTRSILSVLVTTAFLGCSVSGKDLFPSAQNTYYSHKGTKIHFKDLGEGRPLILLHGFGASLDTWRLIEGPLKDEYRLILLDLKGHGYSDRPHDDRYSPHDHAEIVLGLMRSLNLSHVVLVGHSFGSAIALLVALKSQNHPSALVSGLVLVAGSVDPDSLPPAIRLLRIPVIGWLAIKLTSVSFRTRLALWKAYYDDDKVTDSLVELYAKYQQIPGTDYSLLKTAQQLVPSDLDELKEELKKLQISVVNTHGEHDEIVPRESAEEVCRLLPRCRLVTVGGVGHIPQEENAEKVVALLNDFLRTH